MSIVEQRREEVLVRGPRPGQPGADTRGEEGKNEPGGDLMIRIYSTERAFAWNIGILGRFR